MEAHLHGLVRLAVSLPFGASLASLASLASSASSASLTRTSREEAPRRRSLAGQTCGRVGGELAACSLQSAASG